MGGQGGRAWVFGDDIDTDTLAPGLYLKRPIDELARHCLEAVDPGFAAGALLLPSGCGACAGLGAGVLAEGETCIASTARNFQGRMGAPSAKVYLASPYTVAAAAVAGRISEPREFLDGGG